MKRLCKIIALAIWLLVATVAFTRWWYEHPDAIPAPPQAFSIWLDNLFNAHCCESSAVVDLYYGLSVSFVLISICTLLAWRLYRWWRR